MKNISNHAAAAKLIRAHLKANNITGRVRAESYSGGSSIRILLQDPEPATYDAVKAHADKFQYGHFDGMTDSYQASNRRDDIPQVKFVFVEVSYSDEIKQAAWDVIRNACSGTEHTHVDYASARNQRFWQDEVSQHVHRFLRGAHTLREKSAEFWADRKAPEAA